VPTPLHRPEVELRIIEQRKVDLVAHRGNVGLVEDQLGGAAPAIAQLGALIGGDRPLRRDLATE